MESYRDAIPERLEEVDADWEVRRHSQIATFPPPSYLLMTVAILQADLAAARAAGAGGGTAFAAQGLDDPEGGGDFPLTALRFRHPALSAYFAFVVGPSL